MRRRTVATVAATGLIAAGVFAGAGFVLNRQGESGASSSTSSRYALNIGSWSVHCVKSQPDLAVDPIVFFGINPTPHMHTVLGEPITETTTPADLRAMATNFCPVSVPDPENPAVMLPDNSAEWVPQMCKVQTKPCPAGQVARTSGALIYYRTHGKDPATIWPYPQDLAMVAGNSKAMDPQTANIGWYCIAGVDRTAPQPTIPDSCPLKGATSGFDYQLKGYVEFPDCLRHGATGPNWTAPLYDGTALDGQPGVVYALDNTTDPESKWAKVCPPSTLPIPEVAIEYRLNLANGGAVVVGDHYDLSQWTLSSDSMDMGGGMLTGAHGMTWHADWMNGWTDAETWNLMRHCFFPVHKNCGSFGQGPQG